MLAVDVQFAFNDGDLDRVVAAKTAVSRVVPESQLLSVNISLHTFFTFIVQVIIVQCTVDKVTSTFNKSGHTVGGQWLWYMQDPQFKSRPSNLILSIFYLSEQNGVSKRSELTPF